MRAIEVLGMGVLVGSVVGVAIVTRPPDPGRVVVYDPRASPARAPPVVGTDVARPPDDPAASDDTGATAEAPADDEAELLLRLWRHVDEARAAGATCGGRPMDPVGELRGAPALDDAAFAQAVWMADTGDRAHVTPDNPAGATPQDRLAWAGYPGGLAGEVLAWGRGSPRAVVEWWLDSPPHCAALLDPDAVAGGAAVVPDPGGGRVWVVVLGDR